MKNVLIVDDNEKIRQMVSIILERAGYETYVAEDGQAALKVLNMDEDIDVMLLDIMMPKLDGKETLKKLKEYKKEVDLKICMMTALEQNEDIGACLLYGADDYLIKPVEKEYLEEKIHQLINSMPKGDFYNCKVEFPAKILMPKGYVPITIVEISEYKFEFISDVTIPVNAKALFESDLFEEVLIDKSKVFAKIFDVYDADGGKRYRANYVGLNESQIKKMRAATITKAVANEE
ncbi:MAG: response regulator [Bdellovibrionota bacterium]|nr:response regulator [Bdellovibrionota bacterium]